MNRNMPLALALTTLTMLPPAFAQNPAPKAAAVAPAAGSSQEPARPPADRGAAVSADARLCLEFPTNVEIIKCAEKYRQKKRNG